MNRLHSLLTTVGLLLSNLVDGVPHFAPRTSKNARGAPCLAITTTTTICLVRGPVVLSHIALAIAYAGGSSNTIATWADISAANVTNENATVSYLDLPSLA